MAGTVDAAEDIGALARGASRWVGVVESLTGGMVCSRLARAEGSSDWFRGGVVAYSREVKYGLLGVPVGPVVSEVAARAMAAGGARVLGADVTVAVTGAGGPDPQDGNPPGTVWLAVCAAGCVSAALHRFEGPPGAVCEQATEEALAALAGALRTLT